MAPTTCISLEVRGTMLWVPTEYLALLSIMNSIGFTTILIVTLGSWVPNRIDSDLSYPLSLKIQSRDPRGDKMN